MLDPSALIVRPLGSRLATHIIPSTRAGMKEMALAFALWLMKYEQDVKYGAFSGFISHYHVSKNKIDCAGLDIVKLLEQVKDD